MVVAAPVACAPTTLGYLVDGATRGLLRRRHRALRRHVRVAIDAWRGEESERSPRLDVALLPVAGWGPTLGPGHMDPLDAARAARLIRPRIAIPMHWGTLLPIGLGRAPRAPARRSSTDLRRARRLDSPRTSRSGSCLPVARPSSRMAGLTARAYSRAALRPGPPPFSPDGCPHAAPARADCLRSA